MANIKNLNLLTKYQMRVLYYKCKEGATHEEIAERLGRDVNTVQYHMTKIYKILEISKPGKSKEEMDSELKNEIGPLIRQMFPTLDDVKIWAPTIKKSANHDEKEEIPDEINEPEEIPDPRPPYHPPPSVEKILRQIETQSAPPEIIAPPPPGRPRIPWRQMILWIGIGLLIVGGWVTFPYVSAFVRGQTNNPVKIIPTQTLPPLALANIPTSTPAIPATLTATPTETPTITTTPTAAPTTTPTPIEIVTQISPKDQMVLVQVPGGEFKMGSSKAEDAQTLDEELPQHIVSLDAFWIDQTEVTNAQYARCVADGGACTNPQNNSSLTHSSYYDNGQFASYPVLFVSWGQAAAYCSWAGRRLPTEAEWEKAAREPDDRIYPWGNTFDGSKANYCDINCNNGWKDTLYDDGYIDTSPVGDFPAGASGYGAFDMAGNIYEWVADWYGPYTRSRQENPTGPASGVEHIIRGGSWGDDPGHIRAAVRSHVNGPDYATNFIGFRCAR